MIWTGSTMLEYLGEKAAAGSIVKAIERTLSEEALRSPDPGGRADTQSRGKAVAEMLE